MMFKNADVYERLVQNGKKAGFFQLLATQTVSAVWHVSSLFFFFMFSITSNDGGTYICISILIFSSTSNAICRDCILDI